MLFTLITWQEKMINYFKWLTTYLTTSLTFNYLLVTKSSPKSHQNLPKQAKTKSNSQTNVKYLWKLSQMSLASIQNIFWGLYCKVEQKKSLGSSFFSLQCEWGWNKLLGYNLFVTPLINIFFSMNIISFLFSFLFQKHFVFFSMKLCNLYNVTEIRW